MKFHIQPVVTHYKGKIASSDVVNEYLTHESDSVRTCILQDKMGDDYLAKCFHWTHEADPDALLIYNEYGMEWSGKMLLDLRLRPPSMLARLQNSLSEFKSPSNTIAKFASVLLQMLIKNYNIFFTLILATKESIKIHNPA